MRGDKKIDPDKIVARFVQVAEEITEEVTEEVEGEAQGEKQKKRLRTISGRKASAIIF